MKKGTLNKYLIRHGGRMSPSKTYTKCLPTWLYPDTLESGQKMKRAKVIPKLPTYTGQSISHLTVRIHTASV
jgi:hypothetical protein